MSAVPLKKRKTYHSYRNFKTSKNILETGQKGFLATCNFRERECVQECYSILNEYYSKYYPLEMDDTNDKPDDCEDIGDELEKEIAKMKMEMENGVRRFKQVDTKTNNCIFIKTTIKNPVDLVAKIMNDLSGIQIQKSKYLLRLVPILAVCKANMPDIIDCAGKIFDEIFLKGHVTYCIQFNKRYNHVINRMEVINSLAELITGKNPTNKVDLKNSELSVIVEIVRGFCLLSVVPDYLKFKKYNISQLVKKNEEEEKDHENDDQDDEKNREKKEVEATSVNDEDVGD